MSTRKRFHIYQEEAKLRQTSHWDLDYLPAAEVERLMRADPKPVRGPNSQPATNTRRLRRIVVVSLTIAVVSGIAYLLVA